MNVHEYLALFHVFVIGTLLVGFSIYRAKQHLTIKDLHARVKRAAETEYLRGVTYAENELARDRQSIFEEGFHAGSENEITRWSDAEEVARAEGYEEGRQAQYWADFDEINEAKVRAAKLEVAALAQPRR